MLLKNLIKVSNKNFQKLNIRGLALNSKKVKKGYLFFALKGNKLNGENYIDNAIQKGATVIICSKNCKFQSKKVAIIKTAQIRKFLSEVVSKFYNKKPKNIIAVTGTNGKTSVADFFYQILYLNRIPVASVGTLGIKTRNKVLKNDLTSPDIISLHKILYELKKQKIDNVIIEASSHGLEQGRLDGLKFKAGIFTNFSQDHLDYHKNMKSYLNAKLILFSKLLYPKSRVIVDKFIKEYPRIKKISKKRKLKLLKFNDKLEKFNHLNSSLIGPFQNKNLCMAVVAANLCSLKNKEIQKVLSKITNVDGRLELVKKFSNDVRVFIDYAHTPHALFEAIKSIKEKYKSKISLVFGCGGERDFKKRPIMAKIAKKNCDKIYVTDDNPRNENPKKIRKEIIKYLKGSNYFEIGQRSKAIKKSIIKAEFNEVVLVAGKGHEDEQNYGKKIIKISDKKIIKGIKFKKKAINKKRINYLFNSKILNKIFKNKKFYKFSGLSIDSRNLKQDNLFLSIKGKKKDGNKFISQAIKNGASYAIATKYNLRNTNKVIKVSNANKFLYQFAKLKRDNCLAKILAITGSAGKTSLKNMLSILLQQYGNTYASPKSFNNHYGVPISLSNLCHYHKFGVFEVGMSKSGEINELSKIIRPNIAVITNIGEAHIENFNNIKGIAKAKSEIIKNIQTNGTVILNRDDKFYNFLSKKAVAKDIKVISFGWSYKSDVRIISIKEKNEIKEIKINLKGDTLILKIKNINIYNVLASLAVLKELNLKVNKAAKVFQDFNPSEGRGRLHKINRYKKIFTLIDESYNANPLSVKIALDNFFKIKKNKFKKYLVLGDMLELGVKSDKYHKELSKLINRSDIDKVFVKGEKTLITYKNLKKEKRGNIIQYNKDIDLVLENIIANNDYLMIKGSNATGLNEISKTMIKGF